MHRECHQNKSHYERQGSMNRVNKLLYAIEGRSLDSYIMSMSSASLAALGKSSLLIYEEYK